MNSTAPAVTPNVVILNDTSLRSHHGCARVMRLLTEGLERHGLRIIARSPARHDWAADRTFLAALAKADLVVINGEGTIHHGRIAGERLLRVATHAATGNTPVALVNALYQDNPADWRRYTDRLALIATRDERSAAAIGPGARVVPDLSLSAGPEPGNGARSGVIFGDSVRLGTRRALARAAIACRAKAILPIKTRRSPVWTWPPARQALFWAYNGLVAARHPPFVLAADERAYLDRLATAAIHVTGRFHGICLSLVTATPFLATGSNSWKVEALLAEAGVDPSRLVPAAALASLNAPMLDHPFSADESARIAAFLHRAQHQAETLFADLAGLARGHRA